jgi:pimeloyl-ACP methyl ester carboxylesterase
VQVIDVGHGVPLVLVPGIQGRWEWLSPAVDALASSCRVMTFPLCGERGSGHPLGDPYNVDDDVEQIRRLLDDRTIDRAVICGISFGGLIALRFAARHARRTSALILVSTPGPGFQLSRRHQAYVRAPRLFGPLFFLQSPMRLRREILTALPTLGGRLRFGAWQASRLVSAPLSPTRMARRAAAISRIDATVDAPQIMAPTLVVTGDAALDYVVDAQGTSKYLELIPNARGVVLTGTGHLGSITKPQMFASVVGEFIGAIEQRADGYAQGRAS